MDADSGKRPFTERLISLTQTETFIPVVPKIPDLRLGPGNPRICALPPEAAGRQEIELAAADPLRHRIAFRVKTWKVHILGQQHLALDLLCAAARLTDATKAYELGYSGDAPEFVYTWRPNRHRMAISTRR